MSFRYFQHKSDETQEFLKSERLSMPSQYAKNKPKMKTYILTNLSDDRFVNIFPESAKKKRILIQGLNVQTLKLDFSSI